MQRVTGVLGGSDDDESNGENYPEVRYLRPRVAPLQLHVCNDLLSRLVGYRLQSVQFFPRYVQLSFDSPAAPDSPVLTCEVFPVVDTRDGRITARQGGYADALWSLIGQPVVDTFEASGEGLRICFAETAVVLRPSVAELRGPVIAMLSDFADGNSASWRPGGAAFEYLV
ncbi:hypothetical protein MVAC_17373 [Mycolicibacterium vaccae ATCC 25954]|uniref:Uncharacterized protein n=1 Tax=Mycolicibacterium vaccae ATCC 25954 TaxID=1194972 RepID=K0US62_MYCVA|nr:hypothetical protein MYVA_4394 [Mycolicibacterium vaccae 95051]EJZ07840.1 hypothetical protein MVAC_17373 [Mycolicibacterium vaccae ATCC 25954]